MNRLAREKSPYLLQHAHNPVDWYPWGEEAFERARREDKPLLLSVGYSTCHWCHVMERESFSDEKIAAVMNRGFVCVKLDREERPDVDKIYMTAVQAMTGQGGWPLNVFLTPSLEPFFGGTYFPPQPRWGQPAWPALLERIAELWTTRRADLLEDAGKLSAAIKEYAGADGERAAPQAAWLEAASAAYEGAFDRENGGFGGAPKFPMPVNMNFLLREHARSRKPETLTMVLQTLKAMAAGGIHDHVGGGFHRYSTEAQWRVPHFEKMLYDNAQLASCYVEAYQLAGDQALAAAARRALDYALRDLRHPEGGFYSAEDADSVPPDLAGLDGGDGLKAEGAFYLWTTVELEQALGADAALAAARYGVRPNGNAPVDPHGEFTGKNILHEALSVDAAAEKAGVPRETAPARLDAALRALLERRGKRPRPSLDDKVLTAWNGLMISALSKAGAALGEAGYLAAAGACAAFLRRNAYDLRTRKLWRRWRQGESAVPGIADDYAFLAQGLLDLYEASGEPDWLEWALALTEVQQDLFEAPGGGLFMTAADHDPNLIARVLEDSDNVEPSASSVGAMNLLRLWRYTQREEFRRAAMKTLERFGGALASRPLAMPQMLCAAGLAMGAGLEIVVTGDPGTAQTRAFIAEVDKRFLPERTLIRLSGAWRPRLEALAPWLKGLPSDDAPRAYVCADFSCGLPLKTPAALGERLDGRR